MASGCIVSPPSPRDSAVGNIPKIVVAVVIKTGLNLAAQPIETKPIKSLLRFVFLSCSM